MRRPSSREVNTISHPTLYSIHRLYSECLGVPDQRTYGFRPSNHHPPTPGAPKDHLSSTNIAGCRYPRGGGRGRILPGKRKRGILAVSRLREWGCHVISHLGVPDHGTYGFGPSNHHSPTPGAPKDPPSLTQIARCRYPRGGGRICRDEETRDSGWFPGLLLKRKEPR